MRSLVFFAIIALSAPAMAHGCAGLTSEGARQSAIDYPLRMNGAAARPVAVSELEQSGAGCSTHIVITFNGSVGYDYEFIVERSAGRVKLTPIYDLRGNPPPIRLYP